MFHLLMIVAFIILLVAKLAGATLSWWLVFAPIMVIAGFWLSVFTLIRWIGKKLDIKLRKMGASPSSSKKADF